MNSLAFDISSSSTGVVLVAGKAGHEPTVHKAEAWVPPGKKDVLDRAAWMAEKTIALVTDLDPEGTQVTLENYGGQFIGPMIAVVTAGTMIRFALREMGFVWTEVAPTQLKKFVGAGAKKEDVKLQCYKQFGFEHKSNDVVDAYVLSMLGLALKGAFYRPLTAYQTIVVGTILDPSPKKKPRKKDSDM